MEQAYRKRGIEWEKFNNKLETRQESWKIFLKCWLFFSFAVHKIFRLWMLTIKMDKV